MNKEGTAAAATLLGDWEITQEIFGNTFTRRGHIADAGESRITGTWGGVSFEGKIEGNEVELRLTGKAADGCFSGRLVDNEIHGRGTFKNGEVKWRAVRPRQPGSRSDRVHTFSPGHYSYLLSSQAEPVLRLRPGESVVTELLDSKGRGKDGVKQESEASPPLLGPLFIEGAMPGDAVAIRIDSLRVNRAWSQGFDSITSRSIPYLQHESLLNPKRARVRWDIDLIAQTARPADGPGRLEGYAVPLRPSLGCMAVAPRGPESLLPKHSDAHGGDLDCSLIGEGATVYLPVFHSGAFLYMGDGHALQAEGEVAGDSLESSVDIRFTVNVIEKSAVTAPRIETADHIIALGIDNDANDALKSATADLAQWLMTDYALTQREVALLLATALTFRVGKFGHGASMAAMFPKRILTALSKSADQPSTVDAEQSARFS